MSDNKSNLPPQIQKLLSKLEESGVKFEVGNLEDLLKNPEKIFAGSLAASGNTENPEAECQCPRCVGRRAREAFAKAMGIPPAIQASLDRQAEFLAKKLVENVGLLNSVKAELQRQVEINDANMAKIADLEERVLKQSRDNTDLLTEYRTQLLDLDTRFRRQTSLLHKRVTKRKGEVKDVKVRVAATRGRVTRVEKKLT